MKSVTKISKQEKRKLNPNLVETIRVAKKNKSWQKIASLLSSPRRKQIQVNLDRIKEDCVVPGKILSQGELNGKFKIVAFNFSDRAKEKITSEGGKAIYIKDEIKLNPEMKGLKVWG